MFYLVFVKVIVELVERESLFYLFRPNSLYVFCGGVK